MRRWAGLLAVVLFLALLAIWWGMPGTDPKLVDSPQSPDAPMVPERAEQAEFSDTVAPDDQSPRLPPGLPPPPTEPPRMHGSVDIAGDIPPAPALPELVREESVAEMISWIEVIREDETAVDWETGMTIDLGGEWGPVTFLVEDIEEMTDANGDIVGGSVSGSISEFPDGRVHFTFRENFQVGSIRIPSENRLFEFRPSGPEGATIQEYAVPETQLTPPTTLPPSPPPELPPGAVRP